MLLLGIVAETRGRAVVWVWVCSCGCGLIKREASVLAAERGAEAERRMLLVMLEVLEL